VTGNTANIESAIFHRPLIALFIAMDFEAIADHGLARLTGYRRREQL
jgi:hypothetical protein